MQWLKTDRCSLETIVKSPDDFLEELTDNLCKLTKHHYVSKSQTCLLKQLKENLYFAHLQQTIVANQKTNI